MIETADRRSTESSRAGPHTITVILRCAHLRASKDERPSPLPLVPDAVRAGPSPFEAREDAGTSG
jgi:hypothetical protein